VRHQIRTLDVPQAWGTGAFVVIPARSSTALGNGINVTTAAPGTVPIKSPAPPALNDGELGGPLNQPSRVSPNWFLPALYNPGTGGWRRSKLRSGPGPYESPEPAARVSVTPQLLNHRVRIGGRTVTDAPRPFTRWPTYGKGGQV
jgi:hypothetical protein